MRVGSGDEHHTRAQNGYDPRDDARCLYSASLDTRRYEPSSVDVRNPLSDQTCTFPLLLRRTAET